MATLTMPNTTTIATFTFGLVSNTQTFTSPLDKTVQTLELTGARWEFEVDLKPMKRPLAAPWVAFLTQLDGRSGRFFGFDPSATSPAGSGGGDSPLVKGASQTGKSLITDAWTLSQSGLLIPGDFFEVNNELKMVTADVDSDGAGDATIAFTPSLRSSPTDDAPLTLIDPKVTMMLRDDDAASWDLTGAAFYGMAFAGIEVFV